MNLDRAIVFPEFEVRLFKPTDYGISMPDDVTQLLNSDDPNAGENLLPIVYAELRRLASSRMANLPPGQTLQPTALVHEAWLRLAGSGRRQWENRSHFFAASAEAMRCILVDRARRRLRSKHGGDLKRVPIDGIELPIGTKDDKILLVDEALEQLEQEDSMKADIVKLHYFVGLTHGEIANAFGVSEKTVRRHWSFARVWLYQRIGKNI